MVRGNANLFHPFSFRSSIVLSWYENLRVRLLFRLGISPPSFRLRRIRVFPWFVALILWFSNQLYFLIDGVCYIESFSFSAIGISKNEYYCSELALTNFPLGFDHDRYERYTSAYPWINLRDWVEHKAE